MKKLYVTITLILCFTMFAKQEVLATTNENTMTKLGKELQEYTQNATFFGTNMKQLEVNKILSEPFKLMGILIYGVLAVAIFRGATTVIIKFIFTRDEIRKNRKISRNLNKVFRDLERAKVI